MGNAVTLFRVAGIPVRLHVSWLVIYGRLAWSLSVGYFPQVLPDVPVRTHWVSGLIAALLLFVSVFLHELSHSVVARSRGLPVKAITLHVFRGVSELPLTDTLAAARADRVPEALEKLSRNGLGRLAVLDRGRLAGYLSLKDVMPRQKGRSSHHSEAAMPRPVASPEWVLLIPRPPAPWHIICYAEGRKCARARSGCVS